MVDVAGGASSYFDDAYFLDLETLESSVAIFDLQKFMYTGRKL